MISLLNFTKHRKKEPTEVYLKAASQEGTANIAGSLLLRPVGFLSHEDNENARLSVTKGRRASHFISRVSRILFSQGRFARSHFNDDLPSPVSFLPSTNSSSKSNIG